METKIGKCGDSLYVVVPKQAVETLAWGHGDVLNVDVVDGGLKIQRTKTQHDHAMEIAERVMDDYRETFEALAKM